VHSYGVSAHLISQSYIYIYNSPVDEIATVNYFYDNIVHVLHK